MKHRLIAAAVLGLALALPAGAASHKEAPDMAKGASAPMTKQQTKMGDCNKQAAGKTGDARQAFMKTCLSADKVSQQDKMRKCNSDATGKKGAERKTFMKECLSAA